MSNDNSVLAQLRKGRVNLKGRKMYYVMPNHANVLVPLRIKGFSVKDNNRVCIEATVIGGDGELHVDPGQLVDFTAAARDLYRRRRDAAAYTNQQGFNSYGTNITSLRTNVTRELAKLTKAQQAKVMAELGQIPVTKQDTNGLRRAGQKIAQLKFRLDSNPEYED